MEIEPDSMGNWKVEAERGVESQVSDEVEGIEPR